MTIAEVGWLGEDNKWERERRATIDMQRWRYELENGRAPPQTAVRREKLFVASIDVDLTAGLCEVAVPVLNGVARVN